jgi:FAD/FMN-containing dehydrogenase
LRLGGRRDLAQLVLADFATACRIAVVPQGGNTGLAGASVPYDDEVIISLEGMDKVIDFTPVRCARNCDGNHPRCFQLVH